MASWVLPGDAEDRAILDATRRADPSAFDLLYRNYSAAVRGLCRGLLTDNTAAADDACQETMLKAYQALPRFRPGARIWPWLSTIARNVCTDMHRDRQRVIVCAEPPVREVSPGPEEIAAGRTRARILRTSLRRVERRQRMYVYLRDAFGWSYEQIADFDHTTVPAVRSVLHRGRGTLRDTVVAVARERHEWPLPAFLPVLWLRARVRVSQARDWAASWLSRLDPSAAISAVVGSTAFVQTSVAAIAFVGAATINPFGGGFATPPQMVHSAAKAQTATAADDQPPVAVEAAGPAGDASPAPPAGSASVGSVRVGVETSVEPTRHGERDVYQLGRASASNTANTESREPPREEDVIVDAGLTFTCSDADEQTPSAAVLCPVLKDQP